jgi:hypothetical protein
MRQVKIIYESEPVGIGSTILRGLHRLYYLDPDEILYFHFTNILYGNKDINVWGNYLKQPFESDKKFILDEFNNKRALEEHGVFINKKNRFLFCYGKEQNYAKEFLNKDSVNNYRTLVSRYLHFKREIIDKVDDFCFSFFKNKKIISLHKRGTDQFTERGHAGPNVGGLSVNCLKTIINENLKNYDAVFLATDEHATHDILKQEFGDKIISYSTMRSHDGDNRGTHFGHINDTVGNKFILGQEAIIDSLIMSRCAYSLCMKSNLSLINILMRSDLNYHFIDDHIQYDKMG